MLRQRTGTRGMYLNIKANTPLTTKALTIQKNDGRAVVDQRDVGQIVEEFQHHHPHSAEEEDRKNEKHDESEVGQREIE